MNVACEECRTSIKVEGYEIKKKRKERKGKQQQSQTNKTPQNVRFERPEVRLL